MVGMKDELMGEDVLAFVVLRSGERATAEEIAAFCEGRLARFKCPKEIRFVDSLPKSPIGKILRKELRTQVVRRRTMADDDAGEHVLASGRDRRRPAGPAVKEGGAWQTLSLARGRARSCASWPPACSPSGAGRTRRSASCPRVERSGCRPTSRSSRRAAAPFRSIRATLRT